MKAISIMQPWALLLVSGVKKYETRSWRTKHRGLLYIHASGRLTEELREKCAKEPLRSLLKKQGIARAIDMTLGALLGTVEIVDCIDADALAESLSAEQRALGNFNAGQWAWQVANPRRLAKPILCQGNRGLFDIDEGLLT